MSEEVYIINEKETPIVVQSPQIPNAPEKGLPLPPFAKKALPKSILDKRKSLSNLNNHIIDTNDQNATIPSNNKHSDGLIMDIASNFERNNNNNDKNMCDMSDLDYRPAILCAKHFDSNKDGMLRICAKQFVPSMLDSKKPVIILQAYSMYN